MSDHLIVIHAHPLHDDGTSIQAMERIIRPLADVVGINMTTKDEEGFPYLLVHPGGKRETVDTFGMIRFSRRGCGVDVYVFASAREARLAWKAMERYDFWSSEKRHD